MAERGTLLSAPSQSARQRAATHPSGSSNQRPGGCHVSGGPGAAAASLSRLPSGCSVCALLSAGPSCWWGSPHSGAPLLAAPCSRLRGSARSRAPLLAAPCSRPRQFRSLHSSGPRALRARSDLAAQDGRSPAHRGELYVLRAEVGALLCASRSAGPGRGSWLGCRVRVGDPSLEIGAGVWSPPRGPASRFRVRGSEPGSAVLRREPESGLELGFEYATRPSVMVPGLGWISLLESASGSCIGDLSPGIGAGVWSPLRDPVSGI
ncbi:uncharacterized protein LOC128311723 [Acinonyx jubatus]|uniref:Uncharacterized protein LOC128311723 n=1 Tax=Acinonyx jubatus TaxID=32536 RepID=A0ABM3NH42_ACIJB|nr:uncharacterized protein LOC128311723 [Acinonyx jubatus]